jgi:thiamine-phosphate pyrophosphorylase
MGVLPTRLVDLSRLELVVVTDGQGDLARLLHVVGAACAGGVRCVQLREPQWTAATLLDAAERLRPLLDEHDGWLLVNDRVDVAATGVAHGAQVGHRSLPPTIAREVLGPGAVLGFSAHDARELDLAAEAGCDFALLSPVWATTSKPGVAPLGLATAAALTAGARLPVVWLGGIDGVHAAMAPRGASRGRPAGLAVRSAVMSAADPQQAAATLLETFRRTGVT